MVWLLRFHRSLVAVPIPFPLHNALPPFRVLVASSTAVPFQCSEVCIEVWLGEYRLQLSIIACVIYYAPRQTTCHIVKPMPVVPFSFAGPTKNRCILTPQKVADLPGQLRPLLMREVPYPEDLHE